MNNEIKEMLEQMEIIATTGKSKYGIKADGYALQQDGLKIFLDYITNLQQENKYLNNELNNMTDYAKDLQQELEEANNSITWWANRFKAVQQENERLKKDYAKIVNDNCDYLKLEQENRMLRQRIDKAIEYIEKLQENDDIEIWREDGYWAYILDILQNGGDSQ